MQQTVITLNFLLISRTKNARNDHAFPIMFWNLKAALNVARMFPGGWVMEKFTCLNHTWYSQVFVASLNLTVIRIAELQADK